MTTLPERADRGREDDSPVPHEALLELGRIVLAGQSLDSVLGTVAHLAQRAVPGADEVSVTLLRADRPFTAAQTGSLALAADELQYERDHGPCMDAARASMVLRIDDMRHEERWPEYGQRVAEMGVLSSASLPLPVQDDVIGALNLYARRPRAFGSRDLDAAAVVAEHAAVAVANAHAYSAAADLGRQMSAAMASRAVIEQAKGIVMGQRGCSADEAFALLSRLSQDTNRKVRDVAASLVEQVQAGGPAPRP